MDNLTNQLVKQIYHRKFTLHFVPDSCVSSAKSHLQLPLPKHSPLFAFELKRSKHSSLQSPDSQHWHLDPEYVLLSSVVAFLHWHCAVPSLLQSSFPWMTHSPFPNMIMPVGIKLYVYMYNYKKSLPHLFQDLNIPWHVVCVPSTWQNSSVTSFTLIWQQSPSNPGLHSHLPQKHFPPLRQSPASHCSLLICLPSSHSQNRPYHLGKEYLL